MTFELITVGNELLTGKTLNTNCQWIGEKITELGGLLRKCVVVRDDLHEISQVVRYALRTRPEFILTVGGLGPTYDDKTLQGVALALKRRLVVNRRALGMVRRKYEEMVQSGLLEKIEMTEARVKMAMLPFGATPMHNPVGTAPGVMVKADSVRIACLPGVPAEMKAIFESSLIPIISKMVGKSFTCRRALQLSKILESSLAPLIDKVLRRAPQVYVKSHPKGVEGGVSRIEVELTFSSSSEREARRKVEEAANYLLQLAASQGAVVESE